MVVHERFRRPVIAREQGGTHLIQVIGGTRLIVVARSARPYGGLVQSDVILLDTAIDQSTHVAIAYRQRIREGVARILIVPQRKRLGEGHTRPERQKDQATYPSEKI